MGDTRQIESTEGLWHAHEEEQDAERLTPYEAAIWRTVAVNQALDCGAVRTLPRVPTYFPPRLGGADERVLVDGPFQLRDHVALGDGIYTQQSGMMLATGAGGLALTGAFAIGQVIGNSKRRSRAQALATPRWHVVAQG